MRRLACEIRIERPPEEVFAYLSRLENHWEIAGDRLVSRYEQLDERTARVKFGPPGIRRWATSRIERTIPPRLIEGTAATGRSAGTVRWLIQPAPGGATIARFEQELRPAPLDDRLLVALSTWWLERHYRRTLERLKARVEGG